MPKEDKRIVDLIYLEKPKDDATIIKNYHFSIDHWKETLKKLQEFYFEQHFNSTSPDVIEILGMRKFLGKFIQTRLEWIISSVSDPALRSKYLNVMPPFAQQGGIKRILLHFFQMSESSDKKGIVYQPKNDIEKEISILWDIYKLRKTIDSIVTIKKSLEKPDCFPSMFSIEQRYKCLDSLKTVFQLMFQMSIQKQYQKNLYVELTSDHMQPESVLERRSQNKSYVYPHVISKFDYRNHFFYVYFSSGMKAKIGGELKSFHFNYLDFEIIKQEFLINWMNSRLKDNPRKKEIYSKYSIGNKTIDEIVENDPMKEIEVLKMLPLNVFNDITAEVNEVVSQDFKSNVDTLSEKHGEFAKVNKDFEKARDIAKLPINKIKQLLQNKKKQKEEPRLEAIPETPLPPPPKKEIPLYSIFKVKKNQIDYPYFQKEASTYKAKLSLLKVKMGPLYPDFNRDLSKFFANVSETALIRRRTPKHEVIYPHVIKETRGEKVINHLLILGAEVKAKQLGMAYGAKSAEDTHSYFCFFVYGTDVQLSEMGEIIDNRIARGIDFSMYNNTNPDVQKKVLELYDVVMKKK
ncbi:hypothetical protein KJ966_10390 [bacterium]|nr:hypothetical protein [bacterium]